MGDNKISEDYLDNLLKNIETKSEVDTIFDDTDNDASNDFLRQFESELESEKYSEFINEFDFDDDKPQKAAAKEPIMHMPDDMEDVVPLEDILEQYDEAEAMGKAEKKPEEKPEPDLSEDEDDFGDLSSAVSEFDSTITEDGEEPDLSGSMDGDLLDILGGDSELSDIGDMLSGNEEAVAEDDNNVFDDFAEKEMDSQEKSIEDTVNEALGVDDDSDDTKGKGKKGKKKKKEKKSGESFIDKLKRILFGDDEEEEAVDLIIPDDNTAGALASENAQILAELEADDKAEKGKKKKKKEKKEKPKKEKKPKKVKEPKPKKEKPPKEVDNTPPLPKAPVIMIFVMVISMTVLVLLGTNLLNKGNNVSTATRYYNIAMAAVASGTPDADDVHMYAEAYNYLDGLKLSADDEVLYNKLKVLSAVSSKYDSYEIFHDYGSEKEALDALVCAAGRCELNADAAEENDCVKELDGLRACIEQSLSSEYGMSFDEALEIYNAGSRTKYTTELYGKLRELGLE